MTSFTALHRALGLAPGPLSIDMLNAAVEARVHEMADLDWKGKLIPAENLTRSDFPKDVAAMANNGGGLLVYGVKETRKLATTRVDVGVFDENYERTLRQAAISAISPPILNLRVHQLGSEAEGRAIVVEVPASAAGPHLIYRNQFFGAPIRNDADTVWMGEHQIEAMYRARFEERRHASEALDALYQETADGRDAKERAWLIAVAQPRIPRLLHRATLGEARAVLARARRLTLGYASSRDNHPLENVECDNPRPGLRRWVATNTATDERSQWKQAWVGVHHDGAVTVATAIGGRPIDAKSSHEGGEVRGSGVECAVADLMALVRATAEGSGDREYEVRVGIEWDGDGPLTLCRTEFGGWLPAPAAYSLSRYVPVSMTVMATASEEDFHEQVHDLAQDCVNQGGLFNLELISLPDRE
ncbi:ATP-binding protein [Nocardiopsis sp. NPDC006198]|uniref:AlbA family DNA-binding domain-containing protein n=1 Tax=Nocardiopsis sp. NPDC006198 TaxID=3154472 RepID=UPI0033B38CEB